MKKKILSLGLVLILFMILLILTGCDGSLEGVGSEDTSDKKTKNNLSQEVKVGDYIDYKPKAGQTYISKAENTGYDKDQEFLVKGYEKWRVFYIEDDGTVKIMPEDGIRTSDSRDYYLKGNAGYKNAENEFNNICSIFATGEFAESVSPLTEEDLINAADFISHIPEIEKEFSVNLYDCKTNKEIMEKIRKEKFKNYGKTYNLGEEEYTVNDGNFTYNDDFRWFSVMTDSSFNRIMTAPGANYDSVDTWVFKQSVIDTSYDWFGNHHDEVRLSLYLYDITTGINRNKNFKYSKAHLYSIDDAELEFKGLAHGIIKPIITLKSNVSVDSGDGTRDNPYKLK